MLEMDYEHMWDRLRYEMANLNLEKVTCFHPVIVLGYMDFLEQIERKKEEEKNEAAA